MDDLIGKLFDFDWMGDFGGGLLITAFLVQITMFLFKYCRKGKPLPYSFEWIFAIPLGILVAWIWSLVDPTAKGMTFARGLLKAGLINAFSSTGIYTQVLRPLLRRYAPVRRGSSDVS